MNIADKLIKDIIERDNKGSFPYYKLVNGVWFRWCDVKKGYVKEED